MKPIERVADSILLGAATVFGAIGLAILVRHAQETASTRAIASLSVYGATLVLAFIGSALYEARIGGPKSVARFQAFDHSTIHLLIAGTYTPICALAFADYGGWWLLAMVWSAGLIGIGLRTLWLRRPLRWGPALYLLQGWIGVLWIPTLVHTAGAAMVELIAAGGAAYTLGVGFYLWRGFRYSTLIWHLFVVTGSLCHFIAIAYYLLPYYAATMEK